jgi:antitoxin ParD1/3/4
MEASMATIQETMVVNLGQQRKVVEERIASGSYASADEVIQAALRALDREEAETSAWLIELAEESMADPEPSIPAADVFAEIYAIYRNGKTQSAR